MIDMSDNPPDGDAVRYFSNYVKQFHSLYDDRAEFQERLEIWRGLLDRFSVPGGVAIDMGCGTGVFSFYLASKGGQVVAIDGAVDMIRFCEERRDQEGRGNIRFVHARLPHIDEAALPKADLVISSSVVEYIEDLDATLALFSRSLKPGGTLIISLPNRLSISRHYERLKYRLSGEPHIYRHIRHFSSPRRLARQARQLRLTLEEARYYTHFTRLARLTRWLHLPRPLSEDLFVAVFHKS
jgi:2-polyprenyl-3-methyl-5-hydroxy-6-metoxy-1,4-benzoquinol methylase